MQKQEDQSDDDRYHQQNSVQPPPQQQPKQSQYFQQYLKFFNIPSSDALCKIFQEKKNAGGSSFFIDEDIFVEQMLVRIVTHSYNFQFVEIEVKMGNFTFPNICIMVIDKVLIYRQLNTNYLGFGSYGNVYACKFLQQTFAWKVIKIPFPTNSNDVSEVIDKSTIAFNEKEEEYKQKQLTKYAVQLKLVIREYCIATIASEFGIGPKISKALGNDIIVYNNCAAFAMEICSLNYSTNNYDKFIHQLKENLLVLHSYRIIHRDIKSPNIKLSQENKFQFIDYGLSKIIKQTVGQKTFTFFLGSFLSCSPEMKAIWGTEVSAKVDLYYNDIVCLEDCFQQYKKNYLCFEAMSKGNVTDFFPKYILPYTKFLLYKNKEMEAKSLLKTYPQVRDKYSEEIKWFIQAIKLTPLIQEIREIFWPETTQNEKIQKRTSFEYFLLKKIAHEELNNNFCFRIFRYIEKSNSVQFEDQIEKNIAIDISKLTLPKHFKNVQVNIFLKEFCKAIQINSNNYNAKQKNEFCRLATPFLIDKRILLLTQEAESNSKDKNSLLTQFSVKLFHYSLSIPQNKTKISIFHCLIYNVALLECFSFDCLLKLYQKILYFDQKQLNFLQKMRHTLKFQSIFVWYYFDVRLSYFERIKMWKSVIQIHRKYSEHLQKNSAKLNPKQNLIKDIILTSFPYKRCRKNIAVMEEYSSRLKGLNFKNNQQFQNQLTIWIISNQIYLDKSNIRHIQQLQNAVFANLYDSMNFFESYHFFLIEYYLAFHEQAKLFSLINHFNSIFAQTCVIDNYPFNTIKYIINVKSRNILFKINDLIKVLKDNKWINPYSNFGFYLNQQFNQIFSSQYFENGPFCMQFIQICSFLINYDFNFHEDVLDYQFLQMFSMIIKEQYLKNWRNKITNEKQLIEKFQYVRSKFEEQLSTMSSKDQPHNRILMLVITTYIEYRRFNFDKSNELIEEILKIVSIIIQSEQIYVKLVSYILTLITRIATTSFKQKNKSLQFQSTRNMWMNFYSMMQKQNYLYIIITDCNIFLRMFLYFKDSCQLNANMINRMSLYLKHYKSSYFAAKYFETLFISFNYNYAKQIAQRSTKIYPYLQKTNLNPYNALFLIFLTALPQFPNQKNIFLQICRAFKCINTRAKERLYIFFYINFIQRFSEQLLARKKLFLLKRHLKKYQHRSFKFTVDRINILLLKNKSKAAKLMILKSRSYYLNGIIKKENVSLK